MRWSTWRRRRSRAPAPRWSTASRWCKEIQPEDKDFAGVVFKVQANMDANHRDRIAFVRMASGKYTPGMKLKVQRTAKELRPTSVVTFMSQRREAVEEAYAGDIVGFTTHGGVQLGDTITDGASLQFTGLPFFAPELFMTVILKNPLRTKQLQQGLAQLGEEGAIQVFRPEVGGPMLLGAVGQLQFEVVQHRLKTEYDADVRLEGCQYTGARWITADTPAELRAFTDAYPAAHGARRGRHAGLPVHLALRRAAGAGALSEDPFPPAARARGPGAAKRPADAAAARTGRWRPGAACIGVFTDIDDTLTTEGAITPDALQALARPEGGRPARGGDHRPAGRLERALRRGLAGRRHRGGERRRRAGAAAPTGRARASATSRTPPRAQRNFARMQAGARAHRARDPGRAARHRLGRPRVRHRDRPQRVHAAAATRRSPQVVALMRSEGMHATVSSIHVNGWFGEHNKLEGARWIVRELWGRELDAEMRSLGLRRRLDQRRADVRALRAQHRRRQRAPLRAALSHLPRYVTHGERGAGFAEVAAASLATAALRAREGDRLGAACTLPALVYELGSCAIRPLRAEGLGAHPSLAGPPAPA